MPFTLLETPVFRAQYAALRADLTQAGQAVLKAVNKALALLANNPRHPGLNSHGYDSLTGENGEKVWEVYAQNNTPGAWRVFWHYGPVKDVITLVAVTPHP